MLNYANFLAEITTDDTWHYVGDGRLLNSGQHESQFSFSDGHVTLSIDGKEIFELPISEVGHHDLQTASDLSG